jgi:hypothetical protein
MRLPNPAKTGVRSKSAMIPVFNNGDTDIPIDNTEGFRVMLISPQSKNLKVNIALPNGEFIDARNGLGRGIWSANDKFGFDGNQFPAEVFGFNNLEKGSIKVRIEGGNSRNLNKPIGYLVTTSDSNYRLYSYVDTFSTTVGSEIGIVASMYDKNFDNEFDVPNALRGVISDAKIQITNPNGEISLFNAGETHNGNIRGVFTPTIGGKYTAQIIVRGINPDGSEFIRTSEQIFTVAGRKIDVTGRIQSSPIDDVRWKIGLPVSGIGINQKVIVNAEVWGTNEKGEETAVNWVGGMMYPEGKGSRISLPLTIDSRWLARGNFSNFELRNIRIQDADSSVVLGETSRISIPSIFPTERAKTFGGQITEDMRVGVRPSNISTQAVGGKLMLVHGYCSGDAWGPAASAGQFTNYVKFLDLNQNRSHDQFANLIKNFGATLPSFGIVAHSQGGAASLHLYTYYWSGLDSATGTRLIQSVGTPYQGTALAGNLAILGQIFGAGCGSNNDLTYSGAASWLSGIPTWARAKVYYHTTSFTDVWYRYDYCSMATDAFLGDPEDGVVEKAYAQLSGANNLGHKTGWCHTTGMRDPAQTQDSARNSNMNTNAAR